ARRRSAPRPALLRHREPRPRHGGGRGRRARAAPRRRAGGDLAGGHRRARDEGVSGPVLALEASTLRASAALLGPDGEPWGEWRQEEAQIGTAAVAAAAGRLLEARNLRVADLLGVAVGLGPGSYTGTRATVAFARGLGFASGVRLAGVPSTAA